jgi:hypothetical protein
MAQGTENGRASHRFARIFRRKAKETLSIRAICNVAASAAIAYRTISAHAFDEQASVFEAFSP